MAFFYLIVCTIAIWPHLYKINKQLPLFVLYDVISFFSECALTVYNELRPFKCLDLTYISVLLEQGFGLPIETSVSVS